MRINMPENKPLLCGFVGQPITLQILSKMKSITLNWTIFVFIGKFQ